MKRRNIFFAGRVAAEGFTLIEILIALLLLSIVGAAIASVQIQSIRTAARSAALTEASALASQQLERFQNRPMDDIISDLAKPYRTMDKLDTFPPEAKEGWDGEEVVAEAHGGRTYHLYWNIAPGASGSALEGTAMVRMEVQWQERGQLRRIRFDLLKTEMM